MNYIYEINSFYTWLESHPMPKSSIALWHALMAVNNRTGWKREFSVALGSLAIRTGFSINELIKGRKILMNMGRIMCVKQGSKKCAIYTIYSFEEQGITESVENTNNSQKPSNVNTNRTPNSSQKVSKRISKGNETGHINKLNKTKLNKTISLSNDDKSSLVINQIDDSNSKIKNSKKKSVFDFKKENFETSLDAEHDPDHNSENEIHILTGGAAAGKKINYPAESDSRLINPFSVGSAILQRWLCGPITISNHINTVKPPHLHRFCFLLNNNQCSIIGFLT